MFADMKLCKQKAFCSDCFASRHHRLNERRVITDRQTMQSSSESDILHTPKKEDVQLASQPVTVYPPSPDPDQCDLLSDAISCPLPVAEDAALDASQSGRIGQENHSSSDICLGSESFLQSLESIPLPSLGQNESTLYNPMATFSDLYTPVTKAKHRSSSTAMQQELLQAWGSAGPPTNFNPISPGVGFVQMPFASGDNPGLPPRSIPRAIRSRGRGRGLRRKATPLNVQGRVRPAFSPGCGPRVCQASIRAETVTTPAQGYLTVASNQLPPQNQATRSLPRDVSTPTRQICSRQSSETVLNSEENQANEKMNAYIEKFSSESCEMFGPLISVDTSHKPSTLQEAIGMYIDFIILENEKRTRISCCNVLPMPLDFHKEDYYHEIMCQPIAFPTPKFRDWLKLYNVDIEITDPDGQTVSQTTFPPSANFADTRVSIPTSLHMVNWQQTRGIAPHPVVVASPRFNFPGVLRGRPKSRVVTGQAARFGHPGVKGVAGHPPFEFLQNSPADRAANVQFLRGSNCSSVHPASPCSGIMHQFQTISLPALGSIQYFGDGPMPANIPRPYPDMSAQMITSFPSATPAHASNYYRMGPLFNPYPNEMAWRNCCSSRPPNVLMPDHRANAFTEMEVENMAAYMNRPETMATSSDSAMLVPSVISMLPPFSSFVNGSSANPPNDSVKCYLPVQSTDNCSETSQIGQAAAACDHVQALNFAREQERGNVLSLPPSVGRGSCLSAAGEECTAAQVSSQDSRFNWNEAKVYSRPDSGPVIKEMVDQGSQTEMDRVIREDEKENSAGTATQEEDKAKDREFGLDSSVCGFSCNDDFDVERKTEDQSNSEILLRNASIILNGSIEADESSCIQTVGFASQEDLLSNSQASTLGDLDGLALASDDCGMHSFMTVSLTCSSEDPPKTSSEMRSSGDDVCNKVDIEYDDGIADESVELNKPSELLLEVGSNVEINTEGIRAERSDYPWVEPRRKRARFNRVGNRVGVRQVIVGQHPWSNTTSSAKHQRKQQVIASHGAIEATAFEEVGETADL